ncbi:DUF3168 domain-containing protein [Pseudoroseicyclus sp. H15]
MADGPALALQKGLIAALKAAPAIAALVGARVYDEPPQAPTYPYIRLGNLDRQPLRTDGTPNAADILFALEAHSRPSAGRVEGARIGEAIVALLDDNEAALDLAGFRLVRLQHVLTETDRDSDGQSYLSRSSFEALLEPTP